MNHYVFRNQFSLRRNKTARYYEAEIYLRIDFGRAFLEISSPFSNFGTHVLMTLAAESEGATSILSES